MYHFGSTWPSRTQVASTLAVPRSLQSESMRLFKRECFSSRYTELLLFTIHLFLFNVSQANVSFHVELRLALVFTLRILLFVDLAGHFGLVCSYAAATQSLIVLALAPSFFL